MPEYEVRWSPVAVSDIERQKNFILKDSPKASSSAVKRIREAVTLLHENPEMGTEIDNEDKRRELYVSYGRGTFILRYRVDTQHKFIVILRVYHSREARN